MALQLLLFRAGSRVPQDHAPVAATRNDAPAVGREGDRFDTTVVPPQLADVITGRRIPQPDGPVPAARGECLAIRREGQGFDPIRVPNQPFHFLAGDRLPDADCLIFAGGVERFGVGSDGDLQ